MKKLITVTVLLAGLSASAQNTNIPSLLTTAVENVKRNVPLTGSFTTNVTMQVEWKIHTDVLKGDNAQGCNVCAMIEEGYKRGMVPSIHHPGVGTHPKFVPPTEMWIVTNLVKSFTRTFNTGEKLIVSTEDVILGSITNKMVLRQEWVQVPK